MEKDDVRMVYTLLEDFPCFYYGEYVIEELRLMFKKSEKEMAELMKNADLAVEVLLSLMDKTKVKNEVRVGDGGLNCQINVR